MFPLQSGGVAPRSVEAVDPNSCPQNLCEPWQTEVNHLRRQYAQAPRDSPARERLLMSATTPGGALAALLEPLLPRDALGGIELNAAERAALQALVLLPVADIGLDRLVRAGLSEEAAEDLCDLLRDAPDDIITSTIFGASRSDCPLMGWWLRSPGSVSDASSRDSRRELRVMQLAGYRQWPTSGNIWRAVVMNAIEARRHDGDAGRTEARAGLEVFDLLPRRAHEQQCLTTFAGEPLLLFAIRRGFPSAGVEKMLSLGFDPNISSPGATAPSDDPVTILRGAAPLHYAARRGDLDVIGLLASHGADLNARDALGNSPMMYANAHAMASLVRGNGEVSLERLARRDDERLRDNAVAVVRSLLALGADPRVCGHDGAGVARTLILSVMASRDGGGMQQWPAFEQLLVKLRDQGVPFDTPNCPDAQQVAEFARNNAPDNPNDAVWALRALLASLEAPGTAVQ